jgi:alcohol dehydrogenase
MRTLKVGGKLLTCGATAGYDPTEDIRFIWTFELKLLGSNGWMRDDLHTLLGMVQEGRLQVLLDKQWTLDQAREALSTLEDRKVFGKVVVTP